MKRPSADSPGACSRSQRGGHFVAGLLAFLAGIIGASAAVMPDFRLVDDNPSSPRYRQTVSPRDYQLQVVAVYFGDSGCSYCRSQFGHLNSVASEIAATNAALRVKIVGVNHRGSSQLNMNIAQMGVLLPWLQDTDDAAVWTRWQAKYRDVMILDAGNRPLALDNLTTHDLGVTANREAFKRALISSAQAADSDQDGLPDEWELLRFGKLDYSGTDDPDGDGVDNLSEFTFASDPNLATSVPRIRPAIATVTGKPVLVARFRRFGGSAARVVVETSADLVNWNALPANLIQFSGETALNDGFGSVEVRWQQTPAAGSLPSGFIRARAVR